MPTFKVTIDSNSDLGKYIENLSPRGRSREIYMLASLGLKFHGVNNLGSLVVENDKSEKLTNEMPVKVIDKNSKPNQAVTVDFGDELLSI